MKNILKIFIVIMIISLLYPINVNAETIRDLKNKLSAAENKEKETSNNIKRTETQIAQTKAEINQTYSEIDVITKEIPRIEQEIIDLGVEIQDKEAETKELMKALQITTGDSFYLEYIFGAETMTDFIYRYSITEQLTKHNKELIEEMNQKIELNKQKEIELAKKKEELTGKQNTLAKQLNSLGNEKNKLYELNRTIEDEIKNIKSVIQMYINAGCKDTDDLNVCANKLLPPDTKFFRPMSTGYVTSNFGYRDAIYSGGKLIAYSGFHEGIDLSNQYGINAQLYAVANGLVAKIFYDQWGGNQLVIHHNIGGQSYSSSYAHLSKILVKEGQPVTRDTVVAMMGSTGSSTGPHLHIAISTGLRYTTIESKSYSWYVSRCINPRSVINFPPGSGRWNDRITKY
jgi:murein DD-endopeptidase MepM/ murein hydrolase activator NlpD